MLGGADPGGRQARTRPRCHQWSPRSRLSRACNQIRPHLRGPVSHRICSGQGTRTRQCSPGSPPSAERPAIAPRPAVSWRYRGRSGRGLSSGFRLLLSRASPAYGITSGAAWLAARAQVATLGRAPGQACATMRSPQARPAPGARPWRRSSEPERRPVAGIPPHAGPWRPQPPGAPAPTGWCTASPISMPMWARDVCRRQPGPGRLPRADRVVERFHPEYGLQFSTYVFPVISGIIKNYLRERRRSLRQVSWEMGGEDNEGDPGTSLVDTLVAPADLERVSQRGRAGLHRPCGRTHPDRELAGPDPVRERQLLHRMFYEDLTQREIAHQLARSTSRVSRLIRRAGPHSLPAAGGAERGAPHLGPAWRRRPSRLHRWWMKRPACSASCISIGA